MQAFVTVVIPFETGRLVAVDAEIAAFAPKQRLRPDGGEAGAGQVVVEALDASGVIHFLSIIALAPGSPADPGRTWPTSSEKTFGGSPAFGDDRRRHSASIEPERYDRVDLEHDPSHLLLEVSSDVGVAETLACVVKAIGGQVIGILRAAGIDWRAAHVGTGARDGLDAEQSALCAFLQRRHVSISDSWRGALGQLHGGTPGMTVRRIVREHALAKSVAEQIVNAREWCPPVTADDVASDREGPGGPLVNVEGTSWADQVPVEKLQSVRDWLWRSAPASDETKWVFTAEPADLLKGVPSGRSLKLQATASVVQKLLWPLHLVVGLVLIGLTLFHRIWRDGFPVSIVFERLAHLLPHAASPSTLLPLVAYEAGDVLRSWMSMVGLIAFGVLYWLRRPHQYPFTTIVLPSVLLLALAAGPSSAVGWFLVVATITIVVVGETIGIGYLALQDAEQRDMVNDITPPLGQVEALMDRENFVRQNHMFTVSRIKPGILRAVALRVILAIVGANPFVSRPGFLGTNSVIHFARWMLLRDERKPWWRDAGRLVFWSNYDGTWESYVADFIADAPSNVTGLWSNCVGFPRARNLTDEGAKNRDRLVRWARRQQQPTHFWYSAYPDLTTARIRINAAIRQGLASAATDSDARDWLSLFGSQPRPASALRTAQIPILAFGALSRLRYATCYLVRFKAPGSEPARRAWLERVAQHVSFGPYLPGQHVATALALSAPGLRKLGMPDAALATFPPPFQEGMWTERRARALGDDDQYSKPSTWIWGSEHSIVDVFITIYADTPDGADRLWKSLVGPVDAVVETLHEVPLAPTIRYADEKAASEGRCPRSGGETDGPADAQTSDVAQPGTPLRGPRTVFNAEPFGFADGVSQPVIRGMPWGTNQVAPNDFVQPGEIILGYPDNLNRIPPSPGIPPSSDMGHALADEIPDPDPDRQRPDSSLYLGDGWRDLGANGTFLVVRHLEQKLDAWRDWLDKQVKAIEPNLIVAADVEGTALLWADADTKAMWDMSHPPEADAGVAKTAGIDAAKRTELIGQAIAAKIVGRWQDGTPLTRFPTMPRGLDAALDNSFRFGAEDPEGLGCPLGAHIRRANPRDTRTPGSQEEIDAVNRHRILRVGRAFGGDRGGFTDEQSRRYGNVGLMFMCLNADIDRQFEFVQKSWLLNPSIHGLDEQEDPLLGREGRSMSIPTQSGVIPLRNMPRLVAVHGGGYFFMPGRATLNFLTGGRKAGQLSSPPDIRKPEELSGRSKSAPPVAPRVDQVAVDDRSVVRTAGVDSAITASTATDPQAASTASCPR